MHKPTLLVILTLGSLLAACSTPPVQSAAAPTAEAPAGYKNITAAQLSTMLASKDFFFVNVHTPDIGKIAGTDVSIPYDQTEARLQDYPADKNAEIVVYCSSGRMSAIAAQALVKAGYTNVLNLEGGMSAWQQAGYKLEK